ncbi:MAG TPA: hypothetical protein VMU48_21610 [Terracidiphilus sp.]|nr:hypothetical protein [Terracidiphilus sp.]
MLTKGFRPRPKLFRKPKLRPERRSMTVCIAAVCEDDSDKYRVVLCRDWRGEVQGVGSSDNIEKIHWIGKGWVALSAGSDPRADELCTRFENHLKTTPFTEENIVDQSRFVFHEYKKALTDSHFNTKYGFPYSFAVNHGREKFGEAFVGECLNEAAQILVGAELIIVGFVDVMDYATMKPWRAPMIVLISENCEEVVSLENEFAAIGSAGNTARTILFLRDQDSIDSLMSTIYAVYEAKALSESVPGIGESFSIDVMDEDGKVLTLSDAGAKRCKELFGRFGPRPRTEKTESWFKMDESYLEDVDEEEKKPQS